MEFGEKLAQLRKDSNLTQEQLAEKLYVSRTAVSKWESGKGYPNIDSLKQLSKVFNISIDTLLSGGELLDIASEEENRAKKKRTYLIFGILDFLSVLFIFLPLYGEEVGGYICSVPLFEFSKEYYTGIILTAMLAVLTLSGITEALLQHYDVLKRLRGVSFVASVLQVVTLLFMIGMREPYAAMFMLLLLLIKAGILFTTLSKTKK